MSRRISRAERVRRIARAEGIVLTSRGEPLFARDVERFREIERRDLRSDREREIDAIEDAHEATREAQS